MLRPFKYLLGLGVGAMAVTYPVAALMLYMMTGQVLLPFKGKRKLLDADEAIAQLSHWANRALERFYG